MGSTLPVKVALLFVLFVWCIFFPVGKKVHSCCMIFISLNIFVYLLFSPVIGFVAFSLLFVVFLSFI